MRVRTTSIRFALAAKRTSQVEQAHGVQEDSSDDHDSSDDDNDHDDDDEDGNDDCLHYNALRVTASLEVPGYPACIAHCIVAPSHALSM